jgi:poly(3-hydroxybutyrate) depolymerase
VRPGRVAIAAALAIVGLPVLLGLTAVVCFYSLFHFPNRTTAVSGTIVSSGRARQYLLYVPRTYDPARPTPLVVSMHPAMSWPTSPEFLVGPYTGAIDATRLMWAFLQGHPRHAPPEWGASGRLPLGSGKLGG